MKKQESYCKFFDDEEKADNWMKMKNRSRMLAKNYDMFAMIDGPENNFAIVDISTAIEMGMGYTINY
jgi:hypothetical protein